MEACEVILPGQCLWEVRNGGLPPPLIACYLVPSAHRPNPATNYLYYLQGIHKATPVNNQFYLLFTTVPSKEVAVVARRSYYFYMLCMRIGTNINRLVLT
jgi:hypothetical protein